MQLWPLTLSTFPRNSPRLAHARDWRDHDNETKVRIVVADQSYKQFETMTYLFLQCNSDRSHFLHFHNNYQEHGMLEIWMDHENETKVRIAEDKSNQQFETVTYHLLQCNFGHSHLLHFLQHHQDQCMLEIWMDHENETKVRLVQKISQWQFETMAYPFFQCNSDR